MRFILMKIRGNNFSNDVLKDLFFRPLFWNELILISISFNRALLNPTKYLLKNLATLFLCMLSPIPESGTPVYDRLFRGGGEQEEVDPILLEEGAKLRGTAPIAPVRWMALFVPSLPSPPPLPAPLVWGWVGVIAPFSIGQWSFGVCCVSIYLSDYRRLCGGGCSRSWRVFALVGLFLLQISI